MALHKNEIIPLTIESLSSDGSGVGHYEGEAVFVPATAPGDVLQARIVKDCKHYAFGIVDKLVAPGPGRVQPDCPVYRPCGGCCFRHLSYEAELAAKQSFVADAFSRIGGLEIPMLPILPSPLPQRYRNKVQYPVALSPDGHIVTGFYAGRTHNVIPCSDCLLQPDVLNRIAQSVCRLLEQYHVGVYNEQTGKGLVRHIFLRQGYHSGEILVCLVANGRSLPHSREICEALQKEFSSIVGILLNVNTKRTNVITGPESILLAGREFLRDTLCGVPVELGPLSFYQVNTPGAEQLYGVAREFAALKPGDLLLDLYCGMGTIGLSMAADCSQLIGVEIISEAVESARRNAAAMGVQNARFFCADAGQAAAQLAEEGLAPNCIVLDPPRKGCDQTTLDAVLKMAPPTLVMVSCNPATAARDVRYLADHGYTAQKVQAVDMFARTKHCETVCLLSKLHTKQHIEIDLSMDELDLTAAESKATYDEIKAYVLEKYGLKVSSLYISQVKRKCGLDVGQNYNLPKKEDAKVPQCPPEKEAAIIEALKHFQMIS